MYTYYELLNVFLNLSYCTYFFHFSFQIFNRKYVKQGDFFIYNFPVKCRWGFRLNRKKCIVYRKFLLSLSLKFCPILCSCQQMSFETQYFSNYWSIKTPGSCQAENKMCQESAYCLRSDILEVLVHRRIKIIFLFKTKTKICITNVVIFVNKEQQ